mmetsp:Transcript_15313/g.61609  ORF Transcript_15313/g.61609 Transcript_15313/m.61609 type:complete len:218 (+) Transcript_15313:2109-2762(+)
MVGEIGWVEGDLEEPRPDATFTVTVLFFFFFFEQEVAAVHGARARRRGEAGVPRRGAPEHLAKNPPHLGQHLARPQPLISLVDGRDDVLEPRMRRGRAVEEVHRRERDLGVLEGFRVRVRRIRKEGGGLRRFRRGRRSDTGRVPLVRRPREEGVVRVEFERLRASEQGGDAEVEFAAVAQTDGSVDVALANVRERRRRSVRENRARRPRRRDAERPS